LEGLRKSPGGGNGIKQKKNLVMARVWGETSPAVKWRKKNGGYIDHELAQGQQQGPLDRTKRGECGGLSGGKKESHENRN